MVGDGQVLIIFLDVGKLQNADSVKDCEPLPYRDIIVPDHFTFPVASGKVKQPEEPFDPSSTVGRDFKKTFPAGLAWYRFLIFKSTFFCYIADVFIFHILRFKI